MFAELQTPVSPPLRICDHELILIVNDSHPLLFLNSRTPSEHSHGANSGGLSRNKAVLELEGLESYEKEKNVNHSIAYFIWRKCSFYVQKTAQAPSC